MRVMAACFLFVACSTAFGQAEVPYSVVIRGVTNEGLLTELRNASQTVARQDRPPPSILLLRRRVEDDVLRLRQMLAAEGYFGATVEPVINEETRPVRVVFNVSPGQPYTLAQAHIVRAEGAPDVANLLPSIADLGLIPGKTSPSATIRDARARIVRTLQEKGYPYPTVREPRVEVNHEARTVNVTYEVNAGAFARFAAPTFTGADSVREHFLRGRIPWEPGDAFDIRRLEQARKNLLDTQLFSAIVITPAEKVTDEGYLPVAVTLTERPPRTFSAGIRFATDEGVGAHVTWEHRNLFHEGEHLTLRGLVSSLEYSIQSLYTIPDFGRRNQLLRLNGRIASEDTDAYESNVAAFEIDIERKLSERFTIGGGAALRASDVKQEDERDTYLLLSFPGYLSHDTRDNLLDPTRGGLLTLKLAPTLNLADTGTQYLRAQFGISQMFQLKKEGPRVILATRLGLGSIFGAARDDVPPDDRFYAGGGGSIRGYKYQSVGPLDKGDDPIGGRALLEFSTELRVKVTERMGVVTFLDGGGVWPNQTARLDNDVLLGAGFGLRYFSPVGPFRFDIAFPLDRRSGIDDAFQIYLSMGQAF